MKNTIEYYINLNNPVVVLNLTPLSFVSSLLLLPHWSKIFRFFRSTKSRQNQTFVNSISKCLPTFSLAIIQIMVLLYSNYPFYDISIYTKTIKNCMSTKLKGRFENSRKYSWMWIRDHNTEEIEFSLAAIPIYFKTNLSFHSFNDIATVLPLTFAQNACTGHLTDRAANETPWSVVNV